MAAPAGCQPDGVFGACGWHIHVQPSTGPRTQIQVSEMRQQVLRGALDTFPPSVAACSLARRVAMHKTMQTSADRQSSSQNTFARSELSQASRHMLTMMLPKIQKEGERGEIDWEKREKHIQTVSLPFSPSLFLLSPSDLERRQLCSDPI